MTRVDLLVDGKPRRLRIGHGSCLSQGREKIVDVADLGSGDYSVILGGKQFAVHLSPASGEVYKAAVDGSTITIEVLDPRSLSVRHRDSPDSGALDVKAPMPGKILAAHVSVGDLVTRDQGLVVVEAMKMQNELRSPKNGRVTAVRVRVGDSVTAGQTLVVVN